jgi:hypothetical protein
MQQDTTMDTGMGTFLGFFGGSKVVNRARYPHRSYRLRPRVNDIAGYFVDPIFGIVNALKLVKYCGRANAYAPTEGRPF